MNKNNDTISRQAAIKAIEAKKDKSAKGDIGSFYNTIIQNDIDSLKDLPSVQTEADCQKCVFVGFKQFQIIQPEIIRCKDCKHKNVYRFPPKYYERDYCEKHGKFVDVADFCSWAERREE